MPAEETKCSSAASYQSGSADGSPTKQDAIFGVGGRANKDRVGSVYHVLINTHFEEYASLQSCEKNDFVLNKLILPIQQQGGRFFQGLPGGGFELVEDLTLVAKKIKQALRDRFKSASKASKQSQSAGLLLQLQEQIRDAESQELALRNEQLWLLDQVESVTARKRPCGDITEAKDGNSDEG